MRDNLKDNFAKESEYEGQDQAYSEFSRIYNKYSGYPEFNEICEEIDGYRDSLDDAATKEDVYLALNTLINLVK